VHRSMSNCQLTDLAQGESPFGGSKFVTSFGHWPPCSSTCRKPAASRIFLHEEILSLMRIAYARNSLLVISTTRMRCHICSEIHDVIF
jgi:hypothetical protein